MLLPSALIMNECIKKFSVVVVIYIQFHTFKKKKSIMPQSAPVSRINVVPLKGLLTCLKIQNHENWCKNGSSTLVTFLNLYIDILYSFNQFFFVLSI